MPKHSQIQNYSWAGEIAPGTEKQRAVQTDSPLFCVKGNQASASRIDLVKLAAVRKMVSGRSNSSYSAGLTM